MFNLERRQQVIIFIILGALLFGEGIKYAKHIRSAENSVLVLETDQKGLTTAHNLNSEEPALIYVHVIGAVQKPGIYQLAAKSRVFEAIEKAGPLAEAELQSLNLAKLLRDEEKIIVPRIGEAAEAGANAASGLTSSADAVRSQTVNSLAPKEISGNGKVNINSALAEELATRLPGVGPTLAQRIIEFRLQNGDFRSIEDVQNVSGIGEKRFAQIKDQITVNP